MFVNHVGRLQEQLQEWCPGLGCRGEQLMEIEAEQAGTSPGTEFRARVVLLNTAGPADTLHMPWCDWECSTKKAARQSAAAVALRRLLSTGDRPHDPGRVAHRVSVQHRASGRGLPDAASPCAEASLPALEGGGIDLLAAQAVVSPVRGAGVAVTADAAADAASLGSFDLELGGPGGGADRVQDLLDGHRNLVPSNLGRLGEEYAAAWVERQPWAKPGSVRWLNDGADLARDHDVECDPTAAPGCSHIEVKTRWRRAAAKMSSRQLDRLLEPGGDFMLLIIGDANRLFATPPAPPRVRILVPPPAAPRRAAARAALALAPARTAGPPTPPTKKPTGRQQDRKARRAASTAAGDAETMLDGLFDGGGGGGGGFSVVACTVPQHVIEYATAAGGPGSGSGPSPGSGASCGDGTAGLAVLRRHWELNRKRIRQLMVVSEATSSGATDPGGGAGAVDPGSLRRTLAADALLQLAGEITAARCNADAPEQKRRVDPEDGRPYPIESFVQVYGVEDGVARWQSLKPA